MSKPLIYVAHPIHGNPVGNASLAAGYLRALLEAGYNAIAPYILPIAWDWVDDGDAEIRELELQRMEVIAARCEVVALCGPRVSAGMRREMKACGKWIDLRSWSPATIKTTGLRDCIIYTDGRPYERPWPELWT